VRQVYSSWSTALQSSDSREMFSTF
jgi:hypothetical protein